MQRDVTVIAPSLLAADLGNLESEIRAVSGAGADWLHIDVMDGHFVPPITFGANIVALAKKCCNLPLDVHLMVQHPERHIDSFAAAGATRLIVHQEVCAHLHRVLGQIKDAGMSAGVSVNPGTPIETVFEVLELCDLVLVMTVNPGWGGQDFIASCVEKISLVKKEITQRKLSCWIEVDGGIKADTAAICRAAGANVFVAGTAIFGAKDRAAAIKSLRK